MFALYLSVISDEENRSLFERIYYTYRKQMVSLSLSLVHNQEDAEDIVHEVFLKIAVKHMNVLSKMGNEAFRKVISAEFADVPMRDDDIDFTFFDRFEQKWRN